MRNHNIARQPCESENPIDIKSLYWSIVALERHIAPQQYWAASAGREPEVQWAARRRSGNRASAIMAFLSRDGRRFGGFRHEAIDLLHEQENRDGTIRKSMRLLMKTPQSTVAALAAPRENTDRETDHVAVHRKVAEL